MFAVILKQVLAAKHTDNNMHRYRTDLKYKSNRVSLSACINQQLGRPSSESLNKMSSVSILGLGAMGTALATQFLKEKYKVAVWNRSPEKAIPLLDRGANLS